MGLFWDYFRKTLRFPLIWKPGALAQLAKGGADRLDLAHEDILRLRNQFNPDTCDADFLERFAKSRGIARSENESAEGHQSRVIYAYAWQLLGGRHAGLPIIFDLYGFPGGKITNLRDTDPARWAEFLVELEAVPDLSEPTWETVTWLANEFKPARSKLAGIRFKRTLKSPVPTIRSAYISGARTTIYPWTPGEISLQSPVYVGLVMAPGVHKTTIYPQEA